MLLNCLIQVRVIICQKLGILLGFVKEQSLPDVDIKKNESEAVLDEGFTNRGDEQPEIATIPSDPVLREIRDLLRKKDLHEEEERCRSKADAKIKREWMVAARVVNRLLFFFFTTILVVVTLVFVFLFNAYYRQHDAQYHKEFRLSY